MELTDTHTHTVYSGHGEGLPDELVEAALAKNLTTLAITEHLPLPIEMDADGSFSMQGPQTAQYRQEVAQAASANPQIEVICGVEVDWYAGCEGHVLKQLGLTGSTSGTPALAGASPHYQLVLGSVHMLSGEVPGDAFAYWPLDYADTVDGWYERGPLYVWEHYVAHWLDAVSSKLPFDIMAHPDLPKKLGVFPDFDASRYWPEMAEAAAERGLMIEVNTSGLYYACEQVFPGPELLAEFCRAGVPCTISSDAHEPANVNRSHDQAVKALLEAGYTYLTVPTADGDRRQVKLL